MTIGFQEITYLVILNWIGLTRGPMGIPGVPPPSFFGLELRGNTGYYYLILALDVFTLFVLSRIVTSRLGRAFVSIREDELAAQASGIPTFRLKVLSFVIATFFAGLAGAFFAHHARFVSADSFRLDETFLILTMLIVGGMGSFLGPVIGADRPRDPARGLALPGRVPRGRLRAHPHRRDPLPSRRRGGRAGHHPAAGPAGLQGVPATGSRRDEPARGAIAERRLRRRDRAQAA